MTNEPYKPFKATDWYYAVETHPNVVFSTKTGDYVALDNADYQAWLVDGVPATLVPNESDLGATLEIYGVRPVAPGVLDGYKTEQASRIVQDPHFKLTFALMQEVAALKGETHPTPEEAFEATKESL